MQHQVVGTKSGTHCCAMLPCLAVVLSTGVHTLWPTCTSRSVVWHSTLALPLKPKLASMKMWSISLAMKDCYSSKSWKSVEGCDCWVGREYCWDRGCFQWWHQLAVTIMLWFWIWYWLLSLLRSKACHSCFQLFTNTLKVI